VALTDEVLLELWKAVFDAKAGEALRESWAEQDIVPGDVRRAWREHSSPFTPSQLRGFLNECLRRDSIDEWVAFLCRQGTKKTNPWSKRCKARKALAGALQAWPGDQLIQCAAETWAALGMTAQSQSEDVRGRIKEHLDKGALTFARQAIDAAVRAAIRQQRDGEHDGTAS
jgi:hypothetical protein